MGNIYDSFVPGKWQDTIDVNDFVYLNEKPFFKAPDFLAEERRKVEVPRFPAQPLQGKNREMDLQELATSDMKKMIQRGVFTYFPDTERFSGIHPDIRRVALYGTRRLIKDRHHYLKTMEKHLQTYEWIQKRIFLHREIEALQSLEKTARSLGVNLSKPAQSAKEVLDVLSITLFLVVSENPSLSLTLPNLISFIDIYTEHDLGQNLMTEEEVQEGMMAFFTSLMNLPIDPAAPSIFGETFGPVITRSSYRFLRAAEIYQAANPETWETRPFLLRVVWGKTLPKPFKQTVDALVKKGFLLYALNPRTLKGKKDIMLVPNGGVCKIAEEVYVSVGSCDLQQVFFDSLPRGKTGEELAYEVVMDRFKESLSDVLSTYVEMANVYVHAVVSQTGDHVRKALMDTSYAYLVAFGFHHLGSVARYISNLQHGSLHLKRNKKGEVEGITVTIEEIRDYDIVYAHLLTFIESEIKKIPLFHTARHITRMHQWEPDHAFRMEEGSVPSVWSIPPEFTSSTFHVSVQIEETIAASDALEELFSREVHECNVFINKKHRIIDGHFK